MWWRRLIRNEAAKVPLGLWTFQDRERAVQAVTEKNRLRAVVRDAERRREMLRKRQDTARREGNAECVRQSDAQMEMQEQILALSQTQLAQAEEIVTQAKAAIIRDEERFRQKIRDDCWR